MNDELRDRVASIIAMAEGSVTTRPSDEHAARRLFQAGLVRPESMTPAALRGIASWLDIYEAFIDHDLPRMLREADVDPESDLWEPSWTCPGNEMQDDLRWWADELEGKELSPTAPDVPGVGHT